MKKTQPLLLLLILFAALFLTEKPADGQSVSEFRTACDSMTVRLQRRMGVSSKVALRSVKRVGDSLDFRFTKELSDYPWRAEDTLWFKEQFHDLMPGKYRSCAVREVFADVRSQLFKDLITPGIGSNGRPAAEYELRREDPRIGRTPLLERVGAVPAPRGLEGRHIALWQSHGRYFEAKTDRWEWQRAPTFRTCEDLFTQGYVLPYLIPMLENAGAIVLTPRERDIQPLECVADNDPAFDGPRETGMRTEGHYSERGGRWENAGIGFADLRPSYWGSDNPFLMGTSRMIKTVAGGSDNIATATWTADLPEEGRYAVYVSYTTLHNSTRSAHYTIHHKGGTSERIVNQRMGGGTWIYLGSFEFEAGDAGKVVLDNATPEGRSWKRGEVVTADAVRFGGGRGKIARGLTPEEARVSGLPAYLEGALYNMQWAGMDALMLQEKETDYTNDYAQRGAWVRRLSGGSSVNPKEPGLGIPFDLSLAFHTDAGTTPNDSIVGTLAIYTLLCDGKAELPDGSSRRQCRDYAVLVQDQVVSDIRASFDSKWSRRQSWNRSYSESRTTGVPGMILELLSHQNFADMRYGLDPSFRFTVSRSVYKGILKYLSERYGCRYTVQPLPPQKAEALLSGDGKRVLLRWQPTPDPLEPTADPTGYLVQHRIGDGAFDEGTPVADTSFEMAIGPGEVHSFRIIATNAGGASFPSEILSAGVPEDVTDAKTVLIVNNFTRISAPAWFDTPVYAGFDAATDSGVPDGYDITFAGEQFGFRRAEPWLDDDCPGFGGSYIDGAGTVIPGNTFDYPAVHGKALLQAGYRFSSTSSAAFAERFPVKPGITSSVIPSAVEGSLFAIDLICGKQVTTRIGRGEMPDRFEVFPAELRKALSAAAEAGTHLIISGARIGTDVWSGIYGDCVGRYSDDSEAATFVTSVLGWRWHSDRPTRSFEVLPYAGVPIAPPEPDDKKKADARKEKEPAHPELGLPRLPASFSIGRPDRYKVDQPDGIAPCAEGAACFLRYGDTSMEAAVAYPGGAAIVPGENGAEDRWGYRYGAVSFGFPLEVLSDNALAACLTAALDWCSALPAAQSPLPR